MTTNLPVIGDPTTLSGSLHDVRAFIHRYVQLTSGEATLLSVWTALTHALAAVDYCPYIHITSPLPECGKSRLLEILEPLVANPWMTSRVTAAVLMRKVDKDHPTLLLDETDAAFNGGDEQYTEALRGMLNAGFHRSGRCSVCVGQGANLTFKDFSVFGPKVVAGIGRLPSTVESRSIPIALKRRMKREPLSKWRRRDGWAQAVEIRDRVAAAMTQKLEALRRARPAMPEGLSDRAEDVLEPLFAIADLAGGEWPEPVRHAAVNLMGQDARNAREADLNLPLDLLNDIERIFAQHENPTALSTKTLLADLAALDDRPWAAFGRSEKPITGHRMSRLLKGFDIQPAGPIYLNGETVRAYRLDAFKDAFLRYPAFKALERNNSNETGPEVPKIKALENDSLTLSKTAVDPDKHSLSNALTLSNQGKREEDDSAEIPPCCKGGPLQLRCKLCRQSPTYWHGRPN